MSGISKIKPITLEVKNFISYKEEVFNFKDGLYYITGKNGAGKTNFFIESFSYLLYGKSMSGKLLTHLINKDAKKGMQVKALFSFNDKHLYIERGEAPKMFNIYIENDLASDRVYNGIKFKKVEPTAKNSDMQLWLEEEILKMNNTDFISFVLKSAKKDLSFLELSKDERAKYFENLFNLGVFRKMSDEVKLKIKDQECIYEEKKSNLEKKKNELEVVENNLLQQKNQFEKHKQELYNNKLEEKKNINITNKTLLEENKKEKELEKSNIELKLKQKEINFQQAKLNIELKLKQLDLNYTSNISKLKQKEINLQNSINQINEELNNLENSIKEEKQKSITSGKKLVNDLKELEQKKDNLENTIKTKKLELNTQINNKPVKEQEEYNNLIKELDLNTSNKNTITLKISNLEKNIKLKEYELKSNKDLITKNESNIKDFFKTNEPATLFNEIDEIVPKITKYLVLKEYLVGTKNIYDKMQQETINIKNKIVTIEEELNQQLYIELKDYKDKLIEIEHKISSINKLSNDKMIVIEEINKSIEKYNSIEQDIRLLENESLNLSISIEKLNSIVNIARENYNNIEKTKAIKEQQLKASLEDCGNMLNNIQKEDYETLSTDYNKNVESANNLFDDIIVENKTSIDTLTIDLKNIVNSIKLIDGKLESVLVDYNNKIKAIEEEASDILQNKKFEQEQEFKIEIDKINNSIEFLKTAYNEEYQKYIRLDTIKKILTSKFNIKNFVMEKFRPYLNKQISNYISIFRVPATILFDENFELQLKGNDYDELSLKSLSAGEICKTSLAILLASMKVKREIFQNNEFMLMILDEVFVNIDKESLNEILSIMKKNFEDNYFIGIVQHNIDSELEANIIQIEKTNKEGSKVRLL